MQDTVADSVWSRTLLYLFNAVASVLPFRAVIAFASYRAFRRRRQMVRLAHMNPHRAGMNVESTRHYD